MLPSTNYIHNKAKKNMCVSGNRSEVGTHIFCLIIFFLEKNIIFMHFERQNAFQKRIKLYFKFKQYLFSKVQSIIQQYTNI